MRDNLQEALRYYEHALNVVRNCIESNPIEDQSQLFVDKAKIHVSIAQILRTNQDFPMAVFHFKKAIVSIFILMCFRSVLEWAIKI